MTPVVLVAHGSSYPRAAATTRALARAVAAARPGLDVRTAYLDHAGPRPGEVLVALDAAGHSAAVVVPLLLTAAYHGRVDLPGAIAAARSAGLRLDARQSAVLGPVDGQVPPLLLSGLRRRLVEAGGSFDGVVLAAAGTRDAEARSTVDLAAIRLGEFLDTPCVAAFASGEGLSGSAAVAALRAAGASRIAAAAYFLACGRLYDTVAASVRSAGAVSVAQPLGSAWELAQLVLARVDALNGLNTARAGIVAAAGRAVA
ncbi:MAG TPA: CbiX/SirB N-terminal domain-containing protein [Micromonosporaceae bacterium]|nr:CbiX/SirB N-terminal domain-containing protein [Micromonosporaceae bacterium]